MDIINTLGLNSTIFIHLGLFVFIYFFLSNLLFKPYLAALHQRKERTVGKTETAERFLVETKDLEAEYETKAREINRQFKVMYDESRSQALKEHDRLVNEARANAKTISDKAKSQIEEQFQKASEDIAKEVPVLAQVIGEKMIQGGQSI